MSKEVIKSSQFAHVHKDWNDESLELNQEQSQELNALYAGIVDRFKPGKIVVGKVIAIDSNGVLVDIGYKSYGLIPFYEFSDHELKKANRRFRNRSHS